MIRAKLKRLKSWRSRLNWCINNSPLHDEEADYLKDKAEDWNCCAFGENRERLEKLGYEFANALDSNSDFLYPVDGKLHYLGCAFFRNIEAGNFPVALNILKEIEELPPCSKEA